MRFPDFVLSEEFTREVRAALGVRDDEVLVAIDAPDLAEVVKAKIAALKEKMAAEIEEQFAGSTPGSEPVGILGASTTIAVGGPSMPFYIGEKLTIGDQVFEVVGPGMAHDKSVMKLFTAYGISVLVRPVNRIDPILEAFVEREFYEPDSLAPIVRELPLPRFASAPCNTLAQMGFWLNQCGRRVA